uniref:Secreted protein n=1 Tax=Steinernema glaseri TaxID=37863 RepID=A0A1I7ZRL4_9BILA
MVSLLVVIYTEIFGLESLAQGENAGLWLGRHGGAIGERPRCEPLSVKTFIPLHRVRSFRSVHIRAIRLN